MASSQGLLVLVFGVLIGTTIAGIVGNALNELLDADETIRNVSLTAYVLVPTVGLVPEYGHPIIITATAFIGVIVIGRTLVCRYFKPHADALATDELRE